MKRNFRIPFTDPFGTRLKKIGKWRKIKMLKDGKLPQNVLPHIYTITLKIIPDDIYFIGHVSIDVHVKEPTQTIILHALDLSIERVEVLQNNQTMLAEISENKSDETIIFSFEQALPVGPAQISIAYSGKLNQQLRGLYQVESHGEKYAFTQFEATDARRMIPCFDEPAMKARFSLTVVHPAFLTALSNMPILKEKMEGEKFKTTLFDTTPIMSTYLLALGVAKLQCKSIKVGETTVSVWADPKQLPISEFALKVTAAVLPRLNDYFGLPYPYPKLDLISVPNFAMGAMENWGAIFFRDSCLLLDETFSSTSTQRHVANVITHEIVHQWFGNLVTMQWWDDLWLNESFATWLACKIVDQWRPEWNSWVEFQQEKEIPLAIDALKNTRPISSHVTSAAQIEEIFDALTYEKGAACLRMIETFLGEETFREGIRAYIKRFQYQNAPAEELWNELSASSSQPVGKIARDWFTQPGFPLVTLRESAGSFTIEQERFQSFGADKKDNTLWTIPFTYKYRDACGIHNDRILLTDRSTTLHFPHPVSFLYGNAEESGFLRVAYDASLQLKDVTTSAMKSALPDMLTPTERIGRLGHLWAFSLSGAMPIDQFLFTLWLFKGDKTRVVVEAITQYMEAIFNQMVLPHDLSLFQSLVSGLITPVCKDLGWDPAPNEGEERQIARASALWCIGALAQDEDVLAELPRRKTRYWALPSSLDPTLATPLMRLCARLDGGSLFDPFFQKYLLAETPEEKDRYLAALAEFNKPALAIKLLEKTLTESIRSQDVWKPIRALLRYPKVQAESWEFVKTHWPVLREKAGSVGATRMIQSTRHLWTSSWKSDVEQFFSRSENKVEAAERALLQTLEFIEIGIRFKKEQGPRIAAWMKGSVPAGGATP
ncbi:MAG: M1 family metallopeptidase [Nitrospirae bacterium]|nr:M1 family metallopeptidase [Candidatus Troglogloeales bacterium]